MTSQAIATMWYVDILEIKNQEIWDWLISCGGRASIYVEEQWKFNREKKIFLILSLLRLSVDCGFQWSIRGVKAEVDAGFVWPPREGNEAP